MHLIIGLKLINYHFVRVRSHARKLYNKQINSSSLFGMKH